MKPSHAEIYSMNTGVSRSSQPTGRRAPQWNRSPTASRSMTGLIRFSRSSISTVALAFLAGQPPKAKNQATGSPRARPLGKSFQVLRAESANVNEVIIDLLRGDQDTLPKP
jgi:hypothetical protein